MPQLISATLIYDGQGVPVIPHQLLPSGLARLEALDRIAQRQQMVGTPPEQLCEIAGRTCYDSLGADKSRSSALYHPHILGVKHLSTVEHAAMTVNIHTRRHEEVAEFALMYLNRPNAWVRQATPYDLRATVNLRHVLEWDELPQTLSLDPALIKSLGQAHRRLAHVQAPQIVGPDLTLLGSVRAYDRGRKVAGIEGTDCMMEVVEPATDDERWVSIFMTGSRGFSHEQVRHGDWTAISQRSTRFVNEAESKWVQHPLISAYLAEVTDKTMSVALGAERPLDQHIAHVEHEAQALYTRLVGKLQPWLETKGVDKTTARKQARGAARGYLGNGLYTEIVFSASVSQWKRMTRQRLNAAADAEIREVYAAALPVLKTCAYGASFEGMSTAPSPDGIGQVLVEA